MLVPAFLWLFFFSIVPMFGIVMAFQDYNPGQGILHSKFVGLANFEYMFQMSDITQVLSLPLARLSEILLSRWSLLCC